MTNCAYQVKFNDNGLRACLRLSLVLALLICCYLPSSAQIATKPERGIKPIGSYAVSDIETVNLTNGNLTLSIPLASLPPIAGGDLSWTVRAVYNSKLADVSREEIKPDTFVPSYIRNNLQISSIGGWRIGGAYVLSFQNSREDFGWLEPSPTDPEYNLLTQNEFVKLILTTPDGAKHEMRPTDYSPYGMTREFLWGYYKDTPISTNTTMRYYSLDGSYLWATVDPSLTSWKVYMPDGTRVEENNGIQRIIDTNGNSIKIYTEPDPVTGLLTTHYQDELTGREIKQVYNPGINQIQILYQTVGGTWVSVDVNLGSSLVLGQTYTRQDHFPNGAACTRIERLDAYLNVVREIVLPQTEPGLPRQRFTFSYNSDTTESTNHQWWPDCESSGNPFTITSATKGWGSLSQMVMPSGAIVNYSYGLDSIHWLFDVSEAPREAVGQKKVEHDGVPPDIWTYSIGWAGGGVTNPDGSSVSEFAYNHDPGLAQIYGGPAGFGGLAYKTIHSGKEIIERQWVLKKFDGGSDLVQGGPLSKPPFNAVVDTEYRTLLDSGGNPAKMSAKKFQYDFNGNVIQEIVYDWFDPSLVTRDPNNQNLPTGVPNDPSVKVLRTTTTSYHNQATASGSANVYAKRAIATASPRILNALQETITGPSQTRFSYDDQAYGLPPTSGNLTTESRWGLRR